MFGPVFKFLKINVQNWGGIWVGSLGVPHYESLTEKYRRKLDDDFQRKAKCFVDAMKYKELPKPSLGKLLWFNMWRMNAEVGKDENVKDFDYWTQNNWFSMDYYYPAKVGFIKQRIAWAMTQLMRYFMRKVYKGY